MRNIHEADQKLCRQIYTWPGEGIVTHHDMQKGRTKEKAYIQQ